MTDDVTTVSPEQVRARLNHLLNTARLLSVAKLSGRPASEQNFRLLAHTIYSNIQRQVAVGQWRDLGDVDLGELGVDVALGNPILGEPSIVVRFDFSRTSLVGVVSTKQYVTGDS